MLGRIRRHSVGRHGSFGIRSDTPSPHVRLGGDCSRPLICHRTKSAQTLSGLWREPPARSTLPLQVWTWRASSLISNHDWLSFAAPEKAPNNWCRLKFGKENFRQKPGLDHFFAASVGRACTKVSPHAHSDLCRPGICCIAAVAGRNPAAPNRFCDGPRREIWDRAVYGRRVWRANIHRLDKVPARRGAKVLLEILRSEGCRIYFRQSRHHRIALDRRLAGNAGHQLHPGAAGSLRRGDGRRLCPGDPQARPSSICIPPAGWAMAWAICSMPACRRRPWW